MDIETMFYVPAMNCQNDILKYVILPKKDKKKIVYNTEVIIKNEKKFEAVRNEVNLLLKQTSKDVTYNDLVKSVNEGAVILATKTNFHSDERKDENKKFQCSTPKKLTKRRLSCTSEENHDTMDEISNSPLKEERLPKVFSKNSKELIEKNRKIKRLRTASNSTVNDMIISHENEISSTINKYNSMKNSCKLKSSTSSNNMNIPNVSQISTATSMSMKLKSSTKTKRKIKPKKRGIIHSNIGRKKFAENIAKNSEVKNLKYFDEIHKIFNSDKKYKGKRHLKSVSVPFWNTYSYLINEIEGCILRNDWNNLTRLLIALLDAPKRYQSFFFKASLINFICNPAAEESDLEQFLQECFSCHSNEDIQKVLTKLFHVAVNKEKDEDSKITTIDNNNLNLAVDSEKFSTEY